jgi:hypothetical protein
LCALRQHPFGDLAGVGQPLLVHEQPDAALPERGEEPGLLVPPHDPSGLELAGDRVRVLPRVLAEVDGRDVGIGRPARHARRLRRNGQEVEGPLGLADREVTGPDHADPGPKLRRELLERRSYQQLLERTCGQHVE